MIFYVTITDHTLADELPDTLQERIAITYQSFVVTVPVIVGTIEKHGLLNLDILTNSTTKILPPFATSTNDYTFVDAIVGEDDTVSIRRGDDILTLQVQKDVKTIGKWNVGKDFDKVTGKVTATTSYPLSFDWGCDLLGSEISFCKALSKVSCELAAVGGDVCAVTSTSSSKRSPATMMIVNMTGIFRNMFPYLAAKVPFESFEAERYDREHTTGITYPCLTV